QVWRQLGGVGAGVADWFDDLVLFVQVHADLPQSCAVRVSFSSCSRSVWTPDVSRMRFRMRRLSIANSGASLRSWLRAAPNGTSTIESMRPGRGAITTTRWPR